MTFRRFGLITVLYVFLLGSNSVYFSCIHKTNKGKCFILLLSMKMTNVIVCCPNCYPPEHPKKVTVGCVMLKTSVKFPILPDSFILLIKILQSSQT